MTKPRILATCRICGQSIYGFRLAIVSSTYYEKGGFPGVRDVNGPRHGDCRDPGKATGVTPSDA